MRKEADEMEEKEKTAYRKEQWEKRRKLIDEERGQIEKHFETHEEVQDTDSYWKTVSKAVERGIMRYLDEEKEFSKMIAGRGSIILQELAPRRKRLNISIADFVVACLDGEDCR